MKLFGTSGIRRLFDRSLLELAWRVGLAVGKKYGRVVIGADTRTSSEAMKHALIAGVLAGGAESFDAGVVPTPTLAFAARDFDAGAMVTASHNPPEYNGIKLLSPDGSAFDARQQAEVEALVMGVECAPWDRLRGGSRYDGAIEQHIEAILRLVPGGLGIRVALDCGCGAASAVTPDLLRRLGCEVMELNCHPSGFFPRSPEPSEKSLSDLMRLTRETGARLGIAHDGDGDRMMAVDERGRFIPGDKLLAIFAMSLGAGRIVTTVDASMAVDEMGLGVARTPVGDNHVSEALKQGGDFGGEPSGAWVFPSLSLYPDGVFAAARLAAIASREKLSRLARGLPAYPLIRDSVPGDGLTSGLESKLAELRPLRTSRIDGLRLEFVDGWLLVRSSGTEPKVRVTVEAKTEARARQLHAAAVKALEES